MSAAILWAVLIAWILLLGVAVLEWLRPAPTGNPEGPTDHA
jgi:hypothetical protein